VSHDILKLFTSVPWYFEVVYTVCHDILRSFTECAMIFWDCLHRVPWS
jgi:hypothetical protein